MSKKFKNTKKIIKKIKKYQKSYKILKKDKN